MFSINEIFEIAEQIERNGYSFYMRAAEIAKNEDSKKLLLELAEMEKGHEDLFITLKKELNLETPIDFNDLDNSALQYLQAMVEGKIFINLQPNDTVLVGNESMEDVRKMAIEFEKNTVLYFVALQNATKDQGYKDKIQKLINEELGHIIILTEWEAK